MDGRIYSRLPQWGSGTNSSRGNSTNYYRSVEFNDVRIVY